ncbi:MAG: hypothetical protein LC790_20965, partial [Actinobacteria bacterium]|nr:hypothetical protein [Actinomycetota bacterium]
RRGVMSAGGGCGWVVGLVEALDRRHQVGCWPAKSWAAVAWATVIAPGEREVGWVLAGGPRALRRRRGVIGCG